MVVFQSYRDGAISMKRQVCCSCVLVASATLFAASAIAQEKRERADLVIAGGTVVTMDAKRRILEDGAIAVEGDAIVAVGTRAEIAARYSAATHIEATGHLVLPGFVNGHTHVPMTLLRGLKDDVTLDVWLKSYIFPAEAKNVTEDFVRWGTRLAAAEMIHSGITTFADMYYFENAIAEATKAAGLRAILGETCIAFPLPDNNNKAQPT